MIKRIVLTGGPCAGKTTVLDKIKKELIEKGYKVFVVSESATELINGGITPHESGIGMFNFQKLILSYQYHKEEVYNKAVMDTKDEDIVIIYDRALLDNKAYVSDLEFNMLLNNLSIELGENIDEANILSRYDMVIHLVTSAGRKGYSLENNRARYESEEEAILLDRRILSCWLMHDNLHIVNSTDNFEDKLENVMSIVYRCLDSGKGYKKKKQ